MGSHRYHSVSSGSHRTSLRRTQNLVRRADASWLQWRLSRMIRVKARDVGVVLRRLAPIEHAVIADHADAAKPRTILQCDLIFEGLSRRVVAPGHEQDDVAGRQNGIENIPGDKTCS